MTCLTRKLIEIAIKLSSSQASAVAQMKNINKSSKRNYIRRNGRWIWQKYIVPSFEEYDHENHFKTNTAISHMSFNDVGTTPTITTAVVAARNNNNIDVDDETHMSFFGRPLWTWRTSKKEITEISEKLMAKLVKICQL